MKKQHFTFYSVLLLVAVLFSCSKENPEPENPEPEKPVIVVNIPGAIPGLGNTEGEITGTPFQFPGGVSIVGSIWGGYEYDPQTRGVSISKHEFTPKRISQYLTRAAGGQSVETMIGCGIWVKLYMVLQNTSNKSVEVIFPAGLIAKSLSGNSQNGVLLKKTSLNISANSTKGILLMMFCGNAERHPSSSDEEYIFVAVSNSSLIVDLCDRLKSKKLNYEEYNLPNIYDIPNWDDFDVDAYYSSKYFENWGNLQGILWTLTDDGFALSTSDISFINSLPSTN